MYNYELIITETKKGQEKTEVIKLNGTTRTIKSACQEIRRETLKYVSKNRKEE